MSKARNLSDFISDATIDATEIADGAVTAAKLHTTLDLSSKTVTFADDHISGNKIHGGVISGFASTGIDDNASSTAVTIDSSGNVGIGVNPSQALDVGGVIKSTRADYAKLMLNSTTPNNTWIVENSGGKLAFTEENVAAHMHIAPGGNVGIGTSSPDTALNIEKSYTGGADSGYPSIFLTNTASAGNGATTFNQALLRVASGTTYGVIRASNDTGGPYGTNFDIWGISNNPMRLATNNTERMRIGTDGSVGVGTSAPNCGASGLHSVGPFIQGASGLYQQQISINSGNRIQSLVLGVGYSSLLLNELGGNVGIGTASPQTSLTIARSSDTSSSLDESAPYVSFQNTSSSYTAGSIIGGLTWFNSSGGHDSGMRAAILAKYSNTGSTIGNIGTTLEFKTASESAGDSNIRMFINSSGNVGIGTTSPGAPLTLAKPIIGFRHEEANHSAAYFSGSWSGVNSTARTIIEVNISSGAWTAATLRLFTTRYTANGGGAYFATRMGEYMIHFSKGNGTDWRSYVHLLHEIDDPNNNTTAPTLNLSVSRSGDQFYVNASGNFSGETDLVFTGIFHSMGQGDFTSAHKLRVYDLSGTVNSAYTDYN